MLNDRYYLQKKEPEKRNNKKIFKLLRIIFNSKFKLFHYIHIYHMTYELRCTYLQHHLIRCDLGMFFFLLVDMNLHCHPGELPLTDLIV